MTNINRRITLTGILVLTLMMAACATTSEAENGKTGKAPESKGFLGGMFRSSTPVTLPQGTVVAITLDQAISSEDSRSGQTFDATVSEAIVMNGKTVVPQGSRATGRIVEAESSGRLHNPGRLVLDLASIEVGGKTYDIDTSNANREGKSHTKNNAIFIGGGTAAGAIIGGIVGGGKGAAIGAAAGAGGGTATAAATGKNEVRLPAETRIRFPLSDPVIIQVKN